jgi:hypothetical protein
MNNRTAMKTITTRKSILRISLRSEVFVGCAFDAAGGACVICEVPTEVGAEECINGLGGACGGAEVLAGKCTIFCEAIGGFEVGETVGACFGATAGIGVDFGN